MFSELLVYWWNKEILKRLPKVETENNKKLTVKGESKDIKKDLEPL